MLIKCEYTNDDRQPSVGPYGIHKVDTVKNTAEEGWCTKMRDIRTLRGEAGYLLMIHYLVAENLSKLHN